MAFFMHEQISAMHVQLGKLAGYHYIIPADNFVTYCFYYTSYAWSILRHTLLFGYLYELLYKSYTLNIYS